MSSRARVWSKLPDPAPMIGKAADAKPSSSTIPITLRTDPRTDLSLARQSMLIPATWMMPRWGSRPGPVRTASPRGMGPCRPNSLKGANPAFRLMAPDTPCGSRTHHGMMFRFQALTMTSTCWSSRSPATTAGIMSRPLKRAPGRVRALQAEEHHCRHPGGCPPRGPSSGNELTLGGVGRPTSRRPRPCSGASGPVSRGTLPSR